MASSGKHTHGILMLMKERMDIINDLLVTVQKVITGDAAVSEDFVGNSLLLDIRSDASYPTVILKYAISMDSAPPKEILLSDHQITDSNQDELPHKSMKRSKTKRRTVPDVSARNPNRNTYLDIGWPEGVGYIPDSYNEEERRKILSDLFTENEHDPSSTDIETDYVQTEIANYSFPVSSCQTMETTNGGCANSSLNSFSKKRKQKGGQNIQFLSAAEMSIENARRNDTYSFQNMREPKSNSQTAKGTWNQRTVSSGEKGVDQIIQEMTISNPLSMQDSDVHNLNKAKTHEVGNKESKVDEEEFLLRSLASEIVKLMMPLINLSPAADIPKPIRNENRPKLGNFFDKDKARPSSLMNTCSQRSPSKESNANIEINYCNMNFSQMLTKQEREKRVDFKSNDARPFSSLSTFFRDRADENNTKDVGTHAIEVVKDKQLNDYSGDYSAEFTPKNSHKLKEASQQTCKQSKQLVEAVCDTDEQEKLCERAVKAYPCNECGKKFNSLLSREQHEKSHKYPHACKYCGKKFSNVYFKAYHEDCHMNLKPFFCVRCGKLFATETAKGQHEAATHLKP